MRVALASLLLSVLAACASAPYVAEDDPCKAGEATYACQVKRYHDISAE